jgi:hypothetical protein
LNEYNIQDEKAILRAMDLVIAQNVPDGTKVEEGKGIPPDVKSESKDAYSQALSVITQKSQELESQKQIDFRINPIYSCYSLWQDTLNGNNDPVFEQRTKEFVKKVW